MGKKILRHIHDLCDAGLVVGAQKGGSVGNHQVIADGRQEIGKCLRRENKAASQGDIAAVIVFHDAGLYAFAAGGRRCVHVGEKSQLRRLFLFLRREVGGDSCVDVADVAQEDIRCAHLLELLHQKAGQVKLLLRAGGSRGRLVRLGVNLCILGKTFDNVHIVPRKVFAGCCRTDSIGNGLRGAEKQCVQNKKTAQPGCAVFQSRGRGIRTPIGGFGDRSSAIELFPYSAHHDTIA